MHALIQSVNQQYRKSSIPHIKSGDTVRVSQKIVEGEKTRTQIYEGLVIRTRRQNSLTNSITVRRIASGVGVEKSFMLHAPTIEKVEIIRRSKVRRNYLSYMRERTGKSARLSASRFDKDEANAPTQVQPEPKAEEKAPQEETSTDKTTATTDSQPSSDVVK